MNELMSKDDKQRKKEETSDYFCRRKNKETKMTKNYQMLKATRKITVLTKAQEVKIAAFSLLFFRSLKHC